MDLLGSGEGDCGGGRRAESGARNFELALGVVEYDVIGRI